MKLDAEGARRGIKEQIADPLKLDPIAAAQAIVQIAIAKMSLAVREVSAFDVAQKVKAGLSNISDAYQALTPLARHFPNEQIAYSHLGGDVRLAPPWTETFQDLTVRQVLNRIAAQLGPYGGWMFYGSKDLRWVTFHKMPYSPLDPSGP